MEELLPKSSYKVYFFLFFCGNISPCSLFSQAVSHHPSPHLPCHKTAWDFSRIVGLLNKASK